MVRRSIIARPEIVNTATAEHLSREWTMPRDISGKCMQVQMRKLSREPTAHNLQHNRNDNSQYNRRQQTTTIEEYEFGYGLRPLIELMTSYQKFDLEPNDRVHKESIHENRHRCRCHRPPCRRALVENLLRGSYQQITAGGGLVSFVKQWIQHGLRLVH